MKFPRLEALPVRQTVCSVDTPAAFTILVLAILVVMFTGTACHANTSLFSPTEIESLTLPKFVGGIVTRSADLVYISEQDSEVVAFYRKAPAKTITSAVFLAILRRSEETEIVQQSFSTFFQIRTNNDPTGRWRILQKYLEANLTDVTIFRVSRDAPYGAQYDLYAVGIFNGDSVVGVQMYGVAT